MVTRAYDLSYNVLSSSLEINDISTSASTPRLVASFQGAVNLLPIYTGKTISGATNASPIVVTTTAAHSLVDGDSIVIYGVQGNTNANGNYFAKVTSYSTTTFALYYDEGLSQPVAGNAAYIAGADARVFADWCNKGVMVDKVYISGANNVDGISRPIELRVSEISTVGGVSMSGNTTKQVLEYISQQVGYTNTGSAVTAYAITLSDSTNFTNGMCRGIYVGVGGDVVAVVYQAGTATAVTFKNAASGSVIPVRAIRVNSTSTTATNLVALY